MCVCVCVCVKLFETLTKAPSLSFCGSASDIFEPTNSFFNDKSSIERVVFLCFW